MKNATGLTNLKLTGDLEADGKIDGKLAITKATYTATKDDPSAAGDSYSETNEQKIIDLVKELKTKLNALVAALADGE